MSTQVVAEYPDEGIALLKDGEGLFIFDRSDSILPVDDDNPLTLLRTRPSWDTRGQQSLMQDIEDEYYGISMH